MAVAGGQSTGGTAAQVAGSSDVSLAIAETKVEQLERRVAFLEELVKRVVPGVPPPRE